jgi:hypothetical protein
VIRMSTKAAWASSASLPSIRNSYQLVQCRLVPIRPHIIWRARDVDTGRALYSRSVHLCAELGIARAGRATDAAA